MRHSHPNEADTPEAQAAYTIAAEFISRLGSFLEKQAEETATSKRPAPRETALTVRQCAQTALDLAMQLERSWYGLDPEGAYRVRQDPSDTTEAATGIVKLSTEVLQSERARHPARAWRCDSKARLMHSLSIELFYQLEATSEDVLERSEEGVALWDIRTMCACLNAALSLVDTLCATHWKDEPVTAIETAISAMQRHVTSRMLEAGGPDAVNAIKDVFDEFLHVARLELE